MKARFLGTAAGGGVPQWNCACPNCIAVRSGRAPRRSVAALAVSADDDHWILVNASCDITRQLALVPELQPREGRTSPIASLLLTDANVDHAAGVLEFRQSSSFSIYSSELVKETLCSSPLFAQFANDRKHWTTFGAGTRVCLSVREAPRMNVYAIRVPGLLPSYAGAAERDGAAVAYVFEHNGWRLVYAPIFLRMDESLLSEVRQADASVLDGTCWSDTEMIDLGLGTRTSRAMGHSPISGDGGSLARCPVTQSGSRYYTHINNSNPILNPASVQAHEARKAGFIIPEDGLEINFNGTKRRR
jgi:pyrroloquinoline quinone biosynthesis protein B